MNEVGLIFLGTAIAVAIIVAALVWARAHVTKGVYAQTIKSMWPPQAAANTEMAIPADQKRLFDLANESVRVQNAQYTNAVVALLAVIALMVLVLGAAFWTRKW